MTTQASFNIATGATITESYLDDITRHLPTTETAVPSTVFEGKIYARTDTNTLDIHDGTTARPFVTYGTHTQSAPVLYQNGSVQGAASSSSYHVRQGRLIHIDFRWDAAGGVSGPTGVIELDVGVVSRSIQPRVTFHAAGTFWYYDASAVSYRVGACVINASNRLEFYTDAGGGALGVAGNLLNVGGSDAIGGSITYEAVA
jgi:hypothetical protein